jgi:hypothetical protein
MHDHERLASLSEMFMSESSKGNFENLKKIIQMVSDDEFKFLLVHVGYEIFLLMDEMFHDEVNHKKCFEYFQKKQRKVSDMEEFK